MVLQLKVTLVAKFVKENYMKMAKEPMEPMSGPDMKRHDDFISQHEAEGHKHHKHHFMKHSDGGHKNHMDHVMAMCGGGYMGKKK